jgi:hypothetical protein
MVGSRERTEGRDGGVRGRWRLGEGSCLILGDFVLFENEEKEVKLQSDADKAN